ncbi:MAG: tetratricopeptide repeat protein [Treponema sp.]|jgi:Ca-activated chloride channel family protein|nr:tetratricopeptide repeat protein [Treponema sp.]
MTERFLGMCWILLVLLPCSCSKIQGKLLIMEGNFFNSRGMYNEAIGSYLKARHYTEARAYAEFGLGTVYFSLDEGAVALDRFAAAEQSLRDVSKNMSPELLYRIRYNTGIVRFKEGDYTAAAGSFRSALEIDGSRIEAKRNLELSLLSLAQQKTAQAIAPEQESSAGNRDRLPALFDYLRQKERNRWKSREWIEDASYSGPDY